MSAIKVLLIDDSIAMRNLLRSVLFSDKELQVCGVAGNGQEGLDRIDKLKPDVVILDIEMPVMSGLEALPEIRKRWPTLPVIMFSSLTEKGARETFEALTLGANDCLCKPTGSENVVDTLASIGRELIPKIKALYGQSEASSRGSGAGMRRSSIRGNRPAPAAKKLRSAKPQEVPVQLKDSDSATSRARTSTPMAARTHGERSMKSTWDGADIVAISASTGGPNALLKVLQALPASFNIPIVVTQHIPANFAKKLVDRFGRECPLTAVEVDRPLPLVPGKMYFPTGDHHLLIQRKRAAIIALPSQGEPENFCRPAADPMLRSVVDVYGGRVLSVVLTGMGCDATQGSLLVSQRGGQVIAQDEATSVVWGMPGSIVKAGGANKVLPLEVIANEIMMVVKSRPVGSRA